MCMISFYKFFLVTWGRVLYIGRNQVCGGTPPILTEAGWSGGWGWGEHGFTESLYPH